MVRKSFRMTLQFDLHKVTCPGVWLCPKGRVFITVSLFRCTEATRQVKPSFPLKFKQRFVFDKVFDNVESLTDFESRLCQKEFRLEMVQIFKSTLRIVSLAIFQAPLTNVIYPIGSKSGTAEMDMLFERCKSFPGIIAPKAEVTLQVCLNELSENQNLRNGTSPTVMSSLPNKDSSTGVVHSMTITKKRFFRVCHNKKSVCNSPFLSPRENMKKNYSLSPKGECGTFLLCEPVKEIPKNEECSPPSLTQPHFEGIERPSPSPSPECQPSRTYGNVSDKVAHFENILQPSDSRRRESLRDWSERIDGQERHRRQSECFEEEGEPLMTLNSRDVRIQRKKTWYSKFPEMKDPQENWRDSGKNGNNERAECLERRPSDSPSRRKKTWPHECKNCSPKCRENDGCMSPPKGLSRITEETPRGLTREGKPTKNARFLNFESPEGSPNRGIIATTPDWSRRQERVPFFMNEASDEDDDDKDDDLDRQKPTKNRFSRRDTPHPNKALRDSAKIAAEEANNFDLYPTFSPPASPNQGSPEKMSPSRLSPDKLSLQRGPAVMGSLPANSAPVSSRMILEQDSSESPVSTRERRLSRNLKQQKEQKEDCCCCVCQACETSSKRRCEPEKLKRMRDSSRRTSNSAKYDSRHWEADNEIPPACGKVCRGHIEKLSSGSSSPEVNVNDVTGSSGSSMAVLDNPSKIADQRRMSKTWTKEEFKSRMDVGKPWKVYPEDLPASVKVTDLPGHNSDKWRTKCKCPCQDESSSPAKISNSSNDDDKNEKFKRGPSNSRRGSVSNRRRPSKSKSPCGKRITCQQISCPPDNRLVHCCLCCVCEMSRSGI